uniref:GRB2 related adaptor protein b n=1 Tax=Sander lucioperca TaxID=283035 RepID=A0A8C9ZIJ9_SANLU
MEAVALFSFAASEADEISFQKGDIIKVTEMEDDSCWVTAEIQGKRGYVPENYISLLPYPWFAGRVSRLDAEKRLCWQETGVFLVRESESAPGEFSVSVRSVSAPHTDTRDKSHAKCNTWLTEYTLQSEGLHETGRQQHLLVILFVQMDACFLSIEHISKLQLQHPGLFECVSGLVEGRVRLF